MGLRQTINRNMSIKSHLYVFRRAGYAAILTALRPAKVHPDRILFNNFNGKGFGDNPRAVAEKLHEMDPSLDLIWVVDGEKNKETVPSYMRTVLFESPAYFHALATSSAWVSNVLSPRGLQKKRGQIYIQTHHGDRTVKKLYYQNVGKKESDKKHVIYDEICDYGVTGSTLGESVFRDGIGFHGTLLREGTPRDDCLIHIDQEKCAQIRKKIGVPEGTKLLLYAPTFRAGKKELACPIDLGRVLDRLEEKDGSKWICLYRAHFHTAEISMAGTDSSRMTDVSRYQDMADLLMISDMLISDYSSSPGDFCLTGRPVILFLDKDEKYSRSLTMDLLTSPHFIAHTQEEIEKLVSGITDEMAAENDRELIRYYGIYETGRASEAVANVILEHRKQV